MADRDPPQPTRRSARIAAGIHKPETFTPPVPVERKRRTRAPAKEKVAVEKKPRATEEGSVTEEEKEEVAIKVEAVAPPPSASTSATSTVSSVTTPTAAPAPPPPAPAPTPSPQITIDDDDEEGDEDEDDEDAEEDDEEEEEEETPKPTKKAPAKKAAAPAKEKKPPAKKATRGKKKKEEEEEEGEAIEIADPEPGEKRQRAWRASASQATLARISRAVNQRLYLISSEKVDAYNRTFAVLGSTGNVYDVHIGSLVRCTCPDHGNGNLCKHIIFCMIKVLKQPRKSKYVYQTALLKKELLEIYTKADRDSVLGVLADAEVRKTYAAVTGRDDMVVEDTPAATSTAAAAPAPPAPKTATRKEVEGDCPVCFEDLNNGDPLLWCQWGCGKSIHAECWGQWKTRSTTCVWCRTEFEKPPPGAEPAAPAPAPAAPAKRGKTGAKPKVAHVGGYVNLGDYQHDKKGKPKETFVSRPWWRYRYGGCWE